MRSCTMSYRPWSRSNSRPPGRSARQACDSITCCCSGVTADSVNMISSVSASMSSKMDAAEGSVASAGKTLILDGAMPSAAAAPRSWSRQVVDISAMQRGKFRKDPGCGEKSSAR
ncbi:hypothetical protein Vretifemale_11610 [Volvox reticuliferus]|uniref:Uncharacterized protein n=1 Tax=Volvox reticuliferus TaxID=1737510 RepID=A0A8J4FSN5_9CHLO|nr:hypothetical protein Vretifemale_11610 [Volvox reticuliferus]